MKKFKDNLPINNQIIILAEFLLKHYPNEITEGGAIEVAIKILEKHLKCTK